MASREADEKTPTAPSFRFNQITADTGARVRAD
jgi:hypothetical protein